jgi:hypothetical protein
MWRIVYEKVPKGGFFYGAGPWLPSKEEADYWLHFLRPYYPAARLQSWREAYPDSSAPS